MEPLKHECGVAIVRLLKPLSYYAKKYGTWAYGLNKLYLMMEKQHNRGQEGAGVACVKLSAKPGEEYLFRERAEGNTAISQIFARIGRAVADEKASGGAQAAADPEQSLPFAGQLLMGHLRYSTTGKRGLLYVHPFVRRECWRATSLCVCGNFNLTNTDKVFATLTANGQHPRLLADTHILLEQLGHRLDRENERLFRMAKEKGLDGRDVTDYIERNIDISNMLRTSAPLWDGGYVICCMTGSGELCCMRDPWGIRPAFWYSNDEVVVLASERPVIQTTFDVEADDIRQLGAGESLIVTREGLLKTQQIIEPKRYAACSFERIYFSRGSDRDIYRERKALGRQLLQPILQAIDGDISHSVLSFIPNTAESAFYGMVEAFNEYLNRLKLREIESLGDNLSEFALHKILSRRVRTEKVAWKDIKMRTFIAEQGSRNDLAAHVYDVTYGSIDPGVDNLVIIDDSIVRGTTLRESIIRILDRLHPKTIVFVSSSPQIRYPDYYGIDMASLNELIAFRAAVELLMERGEGQRIADVYRRCKEQEALPAEQVENCVKQVYSPFTDDDISRHIARMLKADEIKAEVKIVYQTIDGLHKACPSSPGDWYFSGNYPTPGGNRCVNRAFIDYYEQTFTKQYNH